MRMPRLRDALPWLAAIVLLVAVIAWGSIEIPGRADRFRTLAAYHESFLVGIGGNFSGHEGARVEYTDGDGRPLTAREEAGFLWHSRLRKKYADAAERPWLPVSPDPPDPR